MSVEVELPFKVRAGIFLCIVAMIPVCGAVLYFSIDYKLSGADIVNSAQDIEDTRGTSDEFFNVFGKSEYNPDGANTGESVEDILNRVNSLTGTSNTNVVGNKEVYEALSKNSTYAGKAEVMSEVYALLVPVYGKQFAIGMLGNIMEEGSYGMIEGYSSKYSYWSKVNSNVKSIAGKVITNISMVDTMISGVPSNTSGVGVGCIQWSGGRREGLLRKYKESGLTSFDETSLSVVEHQYMIDELGNSYKSVVSSCAGKSSAECARIICLEYEKPASKQARAVSRAKHADAIDKLISGVS